jgi:hypothetical protein
MRALIAGWIVVVSAGMAAIVRYDSTPAAAHQVLTHWPRRSAIGFDGSRPNLLMAVHPECSCTRASLNELARMLPLLGGHARIVVLLLGRNGNRYEQTVKELHLESFADRDGSEASRLGLIASGEIAIYAAGGNLLYSGGITGARAHEGDNPGEAAALAALGTSDSVRNKKAPVFGCELGKRANPRSNNAESRP